MVSNLRIYHYIGDQFVATAAAIYNDTTLYRVVIDYWSRS
ncbi:hypothetical protein L917_07911 [Phytophthora nicotianae]|uniref:Uncharacterized protein n=1 Tax=Phytophthora nicotianae TaxID=4792 RepID=W2GX00_PHYNI|nr:hypothetical protein L915_08094 [Phytophthora nicotianae]ETL94061.1 hypothetical protein L917_07911 [Phytophthora nicotianae]